TSLDLPVVGGPSAMPVCGDAPDNRPTVVLGDVDSGVANRSLAGGCTIGNHILDEEEWPSPLAFVNHVLDVGNRLLGEGVIDRDERDDLVNAAARHQANELAAAGGMTDGMHAKIEHALVTAAAWLDLPNKRG